MAAGFETCVAQPDSSQQSTGATIQGTIVDGNHKAVAHALVRLESQDTHRVLQAVTDANGAFLFSALPAGSYRIASELNGVHNRATDLLVISTDEHRRVDLVLESSSAPGAKSNPSSTSPADAMQFADQPNFTVAGVTDWTAAGGHGSDARLRTSEDLTRATVVLKPAETSPAKSNDAEAEDSLRAGLAKDPHNFEANHRMGEFCLREKDFHEAIRTLQAAYEIDPSNSDNEYDLAVAYQGAGQLTQARDHAQHLLAHAENAKAHRLLGELDEELGEPLLAVNEDEKAVRLDPSEENYFQWGSELLTHRAVRPAIEVFGEGAKAYPKSSRMLAALGAALFAGGRNDEAALHVCEAADLSPADAAPYVFLGKIDLVAPTPIACVEPRLARFLEQQPESALANYYYGMTLWKAEQSSESNAQLQRVEALLAKAVSADPKFEDALLQLGILYFSESNFKQAADCFQRAVAADPGSSAAHYRLGMAYARIGEHDKSQAEFARYRELDQQQAAAIEQQRKEIKQFLVVLKDKPAAVN